MKQRIIVRVVGIIVIITFLWNDYVWAGGLSTVQTVLARQSQVAEIGLELNKVPALQKLFFANRRLDEIGIHTIEDIFRKMEDLEKEGIICFVRSDTNGDEARYIFSDNGIILRVTKKRGVNDDFYGLLKDSGITGKGIINGRIQLFYITQDAIGIINRLLSKINSKWAVGPIGSAQVNPEKELRHKRVVVLGVTTGFISVIIGIIITLLGTPSQSWMVLAIIAPALWALTNSGDRILVTKYFKDPSAYAIYVGFLAIMVPVLVYIFHGFASVLVPIECLLMLFAGTIWISGFFSYTKALSYPRSETSLIALLLGSSSIFILLGASIFLRESLSFYQWVAFFIILIAGILASGKKVSGRLRLDRSYLPMLLTTILTATAELFQKYVYEQHSEPKEFWNVYWDSIIFFFTGAFLMPLSLLSTKYWRQRFKDGLADISSKSAAIMIATQISNFGGRIIFKCAIFLGMVTIATVISGIQPVFVLFFALLTSLFVPRILEDLGEDIKGRNLIRKAIVVILMIVGIFLTTRANAETRGTIGLQSGDLSYIWDSTVVLVMGILGAVPFISRRTPNNQPGMRLDRRYRAVIKISNDIEAAKRKARGGKRTCEITGGMSKTVNKIKMVVGWLQKEEIGFADGLFRMDKFIRLDIDELEKPENLYILNWMKRVLEGVRHSPFVFYSSSERDVDAFLKKYNLPQGEPLVNISQEDLIELIEPEKANDKLPQDRLYLPLPYTITSIYLASKVVLANGKVNEIGDSLVLNTIKALYNTLLGREYSDAELGLLFKQPWIILPDIFRINTALDTLRKAIGKIETSV